MSAADLAEAVRLMSSRDRRTTAQALEDVCANGSPVAPMWEPVASFLRYVESCEETRLLLEATGGTEHEELPATRATYTAKAQDVVDAVLSLPARTRRAYLAALLPLINGDLKELGFALLGALVLVP